MKNSLIVVLCLIFSSACSNKADEEKLSINKAQQNNGFFQIIGIGKIIPEFDIVLITTPINGIVQHLYKKENDTVNIGSLILELDHQLEDEKINQLRNQLKTQEFQIDVDRSNSIELSGRISNAKTGLIHSQNLYLKGAETKQNIDNLNTELLSLQVNLKSFNAKVQVSKSKLIELKTALKSAEIEKEQKFIKSPIIGKILDLTAVVGSYVSNQQAIAQISPLGNKIAICEIDELYADKIAVGQVAWIKKSGTSEKPLRAKIYFASSYLQKKSLFTDQAGEKEDRRVRTIELTIDSSDKFLINTRVECVINISGELNK
jgi:multidrug efflux pump subunit AcrA (membrane-fusion protein)